MLSEEKSWFFEIRVPASGKKLRVEISNYEFFEKVIMPSFLKYKQWFEANEQIISPQFKEINIGISDWLRDKYKINPTVKDFVNWYIGNKLGAYEIKFDFKANKGTGVITSIEGLHFSFPDFDEMLTFDVIERDLHEFCLWRRQNQERLYLLMSQKKQSEEEINTKGVENFNHFQNGILTYDQLKNELSSLNTLNERLMFWNENIRKKILNACNGVRHSREFWQIFKKVFGEMEVVKDQLNIPITIFRLYFEPLLDTLQSSLYPQPMTTFPDGNVPSGYQCSIGRNNYQNFCMDCEAEDYFNYWKANHLNLTEEEKEVEFNRLKLFRERSLNSPYHEQTKQMRSLNLQINKLNWYFNDTPKTEEDAEIAGLYIYVYEFLKLEVDKNNALKLQHQSSERITEEPEYDYVGEAWYTMPIPEIVSKPKQDVSDVFKPKLAVVVATEVELNQVLKQLKPFKGNRKIWRIVEGAETYFLGRFGSFNCVVMMTSMGADGPTGSMLSTDALIKLWDPIAVILVGIAFGMKRDKHLPGDVLVAEQIIPYEYQRVGNKLVFRNPVPPSSPALINRFRHALGWKFQRPDTTVVGKHLGPVLSGAKLIDNMSFKEQLLEQFPTAIGGEMEGSGLWASAFRNKKEWILIKAVCDWGDGKKHKVYQEMAAASAVSICAYVFSDAHVLDGI